jgi:PAS domain S-box-containing protein
MRLTSANHEIPDPPGSISPDFLADTAALPDSTPVAPDIEPSFRINSNNHLTRKENYPVKFLAEAEARVSEMRYRRLFEAAKDGILILDPATRKITDANPFMTELLGYSHDELLNKELWQIGLLKDEEASQAAFLELKKNAYLRYEDLPLLGKSGSMHQVEFVSNLYEEEGRPVIQCNIRDITRRKAAEEQVEEQAEFLDKARDAIVARDVFCLFLFCNNGAERLYGWTTEEVKGKNALDLLYTSPEKFRSINDIVLLEGEWRGELKHRTKARGDVVVETHWTLIKDREGLPKSVLTINSDITEKKRIEAQFMRAQRMESIGTLSSGIAHDLNNILTPIMMSIDVLRATPDTPPTHKILKTIELSARRGADIVRQVLSFARGLEGDRLEIQPKHILKDLENIIKDTFPKNISLEFVVSLDTWTVLGDPTQLHQILLNLCVNARDAMPTGGKLTVSIENRMLDEQYAEDQQYAATHIQAKAGPYVKIGVTDSGSGIRPELLNKIFEPFFTTKELDKGTGLGLSTVMAIVKSHDGIINVYSEPGAGTTFNVYIPAMTSYCKDASIAGEEVRMPRGKGETILVVDDEASIVTITSETLQAFGYRVLTAINGADAIAIYAEHKKDIALVLTDMMMPVMDGLATIHALTRMNPNVRIIAASGLAANSVMTKVSGDGVKNFLTKPYTAGTLLRSVRMAIDDASAVKA